MSVRQKAFALRFVDQEQYLAVGAGFFLQAAVAGFFLQVAVGAAAERSRLSAV
nr:hypothetical protein [Anthocerotibacter panamensis]